MMLLMMLMMLMMMKKVMMLMMMKKDKKEEEEKEEKEKEKEKEKEALKKQNLHTGVRKKRALQKTNAFAGSEAHGKAQVGPKKAQKSSKMAQMRPEWPTKVELGSEMANNCPRSLPDKAKTAQSGPNTAPR